MTKTEPDREPFFSTLLVVFELLKQDVDSNNRAAAVAMMSRSLPDRPGRSRSVQIDIIS